LSDLLFVAARVLNRLDGKAGPMWDRKPTCPRTSQARPQFRGDPE